MESQLQMFKNLVFASIISADNDEFDEDTKQAIIERYDRDAKEQNWAYVLEPIQDENARNKLIELFNKEDETD